METTKRAFTKLHRGINFAAFTEEDLQKAIERSDFERTIFYRSSVYTYSCIARELEDKSVEFIQYFNNGESKEVTKFANKDEFWKRFN